MCRNTKLAMMSMLPILCVCENPGYNGCLRDGCAVRTVVLSGNIYGDTFVVHVQHYRSRYSDCFSDAYVFCNMPPFG